MGPLCLTDKAKGLLARVFQQNRYNNPLPHDARLSNSQRFGTLDVLLSCFARTCQTDWQYFAKSSTRFRSRSALTETFVGYVSGRQYSLSIESSFRECSLEEDDARAPIWNLESRAGIGHCGEATPTSTAQSATASESMPVIESRGMRSAVASCWRDDIESSPQVEDALHGL